MTDKQENIKNIYDLDKGQAKPKEPQPNNSAADRVLVPSSLEVKSGSVERYVISKQIAKMREPSLLSVDDLNQKRIIHPESPDRTIIDKFRELRTRLLEISKGNNFTLAVTGVTEGCGASFAAINLAAAFALDSSKTALVIDCNLREPSLHNILDLMPDLGVTDFIEDPDMDIASVIYPTGIKRLRLIPAGSRRESSGEFFTSFRMRQFLHSLRKRYPDRFIILDTPSIAVSPDARIISELCDLTLVVVPHGRVTESQIVSAVSSIPSQKCAGVLVNG
ncbi:polysaccharide biosynthesis protein [Hahella sp. KA22]|uniref:XrtA-associated tyrosine autokinase n=1 Tax=Hahella sp. KA22 TaxID=1628392 RepID=UPI000FDD81B8|nr:XrtA-associated tyrosine autokinase [Hahella sp. KA22]AZZ93004.1 polysaccharide biosynthesis protein [Hahella sp. KA22]QAY56378.1 polysaccharide biosynthesis protein [Hahella sp. KA22]